MHPGPLPAGAEALGTVTRGAGDTGALLRRGARAGAGRPLLGDAPMQRKNVSLDARSIDVLRMLGGGDLSAGIRRAAARVAE